MSLHSCFCCRCCCAGRFHYRSTAELGQHDSVSSLVSFFLIDFVFGSDLRVFSYLGEGRVSWLGLRRKTIFVLTWQPNNAILFISAVVSPATVSQGWLDGGIDSTYGKISTIDKRKNKQKVLFWSNLWLYGCVLLVVVTVTDLVRASGGSFFLFIFSWWVVWRCGDPFDCTDEVRLSLHVSRLYTMTNKKD